MKIGLYYFTGTGNSLAVTKDLAKELHDDVELISIPNLEQEDIIIVSHDVVGIIYPAWLHHIPPAVERFINKLIINNSYMFSVCTYALNPYNSLFDINILLKQKGSKLSAGFCIAMGGKYVLLKDITFSDEENEKRFAEARKKIKEIAKIVNNRTEYGIEGTFDEKENGHLIEFHRNIYRVHERFWVTENCNLCEQCVRICPNKNIEIDNGTILWKDRCDYCLACLHWCPQSAVQNGELSPICRRFHHPSISVNDLLQR